MLACIQARDTEFWLGLFIRAIADDSASGRNDLKVVNQLQRLSVIVELPYEASTVHRRTRGSLFRLLHIFLDCK